MSILRQKMAPISDKTWEMINLQAKRVLLTHLSARKFVDIEGPLGFDIGAVNTGRLRFIDDNKVGLKYGVFQTLPLVEVRVPFNLNIWELDSIERGVEDIDFSELDKAGKNIALFEEKSIYYGFKEANIKGLRESNQYGELKFPEEVENLPSVIIDSLKNSKKGILRFRMKQVSL